MTWCVRPFLLALFFGRAAAAFAQAPAPAPSPASAPLTFGAEVDLVTVDAVAVDRKGQPLPTLGKDDFEIYEDGKKQAIVSFEAVQLPLPAAGNAPPPPKPRLATNVEGDERRARTFVIVYDDIHLTPLQAHRAKNAVAEFLKRGTAEGDRVMLVSTGGSTWWSTKMPAGRQELLDLVKRLDGRHIPDMGPDRMTEYEAMRIHVFQDPQVTEQVTRRFETFGARGKSELQQRAEQDFNLGDPLVRARSQEIYYQSVTRNRITLTAMERVLESLIPVKGRKALILVSEGFINDPHLDDFKDVLQASRQANTAIYFVDTRGLGGLSTYASAEFGPALDTRDLGAGLIETAEAAGGSEDLSNSSGGFTVRNTNDLARGIQRIVDESRVYYLLGYNPTNTARDGRFRKIEVKLAATQKGAKVRARRGYYAPLDDPAKLAERQKKKREYESKDADIQAALDSPYERQEIPLRMTSWVFDETILGKASVVVATEVDVRDFGFEEKEGRFLDTLEFLLVTAHRETGEFFRFDQQIDMKLLPATRERLGRSWYPIVRTFELAPGGYQAKMVVRDKNSKRIGTVIHEFEVPALGALRLSTPVITDTLSPGGSGKEGAVRPAMVARRAFPADATLYTSFEVYGAQKEKATSMPRVSAGYEIRRTADGQVIAAAEPSVIKPTSLGRLSRIVGAPLEGASPGEYELVLRVKDELAGTSLEHRETFAVVASAGAPAPPAPVPPADGAPVAPGDATPSAGSAPAPSR